MNIKSQASFNEIRNASRNSSDYIARRREDGREDEYNVLGAAKTTWPIFLSGLRKRGKKKCVEAVKKGGRKQEWRSLWGGGGAEAIPLFTFSFFLFVQVEAS